MDLSKIKRTNLRRYLNEKYGLEFNRSGYAICPFHPDEKNPSFQVTLHNGVWRWTDWHLNKDEPGFSGTIIDFVAKKESLPVGEAIAKLQAEFSTALVEEFTRRRQTRQDERGSQAWERTEYIYRTLDGQEVYKKVKLKNRDGTKKYWFEKKSDGQWLRNEGSFEPIPYRLERFPAQNELIICEGEKDADYVNSLGIDFLATSAPLGAHNWDERLTPHFAGKTRLIFLYDVGNERDVLFYAERLQRAFPETAISIASVPLAQREADISDYLDAFADIDQKRTALLELIEKATRFVPQAPALPIIEPASPVIEPAPPIELDIENRFLRTWLSSLRRYTDAPNIFLLFSGIAVLSGVLNKFYFRYPRRTQLNLFILLLAPSTYYRKSTCTDITADYLEEVNPGLRLPDSFTVEALYEILKKQPRGLLIWPELIQVKEFQMSKEYNRGLPAFLTDIYDFKDKIRRWTVGNGEIVVERPVISILAAGITDWFTKNLQAIDFHGGLWTRFLFVPAPEQERRFTLPQSFELDRAVIQQLITLNNLPEGEVSLSQIEPLLQEWGERHQQETMRLGTGILAAMYQRLEVMLIKVAAILQLSEDQSPTITPATFREAVKIIDFMKAQLPAFFKNEIQFGEQEKARATILKFIKRKRQALKKEILQGTKVPKKLADPALAQLIDEEEIRETKGPVPDHGGRQASFYEYIGTDAE
jgi:hypothetical protein